VNRQLAVGLQRRLEALGVKVVLTRTTNDVDLSGTERANIARSASADLLVVIDVQSSSEASPAGITTLFPANNQWTQGTVGDARRAAEAIQRAVIAQTGAVDLGTSVSAPSAELNWSGVPSVVVDAGYLSNPVEDRLLGGVRYQGLLCDGMDDGVVAYLDGGR